jgi:hypothetical protein
MKTDSIALTARGKVICQDVARHGNGYIIVADGCSSSPHSEVGAMLLAMTAKNTIELGYWPSKFGEVIIGEAWEIARRLGLPCEAMDATLIVGYSEGGTFRVLVYGDGTVWYKDGERFEIYSHETFGIINGEVKSLPYYLSYRINVKRSNDFFMAKPESCINGKAKEFCTVHEYSFGTCGLIGISTDGISAITDDAANKITIGNALSKFLNFPVAEGAFLARRAWATMSREKWTLNDDFGMAVAIWK